MWRHRARTINALIALAVACGLAPYVLSLRDPTTRFSHDSWSYWDLAQNAFTNFCQPFAIRSYGAPGYSDSFPPMWPVVIAVFDRATHLGSATQVVLAIACALATAIPLRSIARLLLPRRRVADAVATLAWLGLIMFDGYQSEVIGGRSIPVAILLILAAIAVLARTTLSFVASAGAGLLLGAACLARFDALLPALAMIAGVVATSRVRLLERSALVAAFALALLPWVAYSEQRFHKVWASDNVGVALSAVPIGARTYLPPRKTVFTQTAAWLVRRAKNSARVVVAFARAIVAFPFAALSLMLAAITRRRLFAIRPSGIASPRLMMAAALIGLGSLAVTGYFDARYFALACLTITLISMTFAVGQQASVRLLLTAGSLYACIVGIWSVAQLRFRSGDWMVPASEIERIGRDHAMSVILSGDVECNQIGARARVHLVCLPEDWARLDSTTRRRFLTDFSVTHAQINAPAERTGRLEIVPIDRVSGDDVLPKR